ncbi:type IX secretion/gliding motility protein PorT/SprT [Arcticibacterium luteifluviistationis]|uniref:type IX secretion/gliding motility protein PorT/SprT n=1 Tax=Arcticibacterium luteifluviistationis TaxID=1784714 RepID=UPI0013A6DB06|nr:outer membrane beta-barrel protein [Arcticibacterium luteifluviistationis]
MTRINNNRKALEGAYRFFLKASLLLMISLTFSSNAFSQASTVKHQADYDAKPIRFGYFLGVAFSNYRIKHNQLFLSGANTTINSITSPMDYGIKMGGLMNLNTINPKIDVRIIPTVAIYAKKLSVNEDPEIIPSREQAWFELPVLIRYKSLRRGNMRMNVFGGMRLGFETNAVNLARKSKIGKTAGIKSSDLSIEYGAGMELFRQFFKLSPEIHFSHGIKNLIDPAVGSTSITPISVIDRLNSHAVTFYLFFE